MRRYALRTLRTGDYVIASNDAQTVYRIRRYWEDGSVEGLRGDFWEVSEVSASLFLATSSREYLSGADTLDAIDGLPWRILADSYRTRRAALARVFPDEEDA